MAAKQKTSQNVITIFLLVGVVAFALLLGACASVEYAGTRIRTPEAPYNTYYAPDYYPYYPWDAYYGGAYYYGE